MDTPQGGGCQNNETPQVQDGSKHTVQKICSTKLDLPPSCVEFWPLDPEYFVVGTYHLEKEEEDKDKEVKDDRGEKINEDEDQDEEFGSTQGKNQQSRSGSLVLFHLSSNLELTQKQTLPSPSAILDLHFHPQKPHLLATASSTGNITFYTLSKASSSSPDAAPILALHTVCSPFPSTTLVLSLAWHPRLDYILGVTLSTGTVALLQLSYSQSQTLNAEDAPIGLTVLRQDLNPHAGHFVWTLAFSPPYPTSSQSHTTSTSTSKSTSKSTATSTPHPTTHHPQALYSGGDDSLLRCTAFPSLTSITHSASSLSDASPGGVAGIKGHDAGVTAILPLPLPPLSERGEFKLGGPGRDVLLTGSYDDCVRVVGGLDYRAVVGGGGEGDSDGDGDNEGGFVKSKPKVLACLKIGGGVWRLKFLRDYALRTSSHTDTPQILRYKVLASCMHAGARILEVCGNVATNEWSIRVLGEFTEHRSMNYGSDVQPPPLLPLPLGEGEEGDGNGDGGKEGIDRLDDSTAVCVSTSFYDLLLCVWKYKDGGW